MNVSLYLWLIPLLPFLGFLVNGLLGRSFPKPLVSAVALIFPLASFGVVARAAYLAWSGALVFPYTEQFLGGSWISAGPIQIDFTFALDQLSILMLLIITGVGFLIHLYSVGYMGEEEGYWRYFSYLNLFLFFMTVLVLAENYLVMFVGWEGVGLASYLLIGFYYNRDSAARAGRKAFVANRVGDFGFLIGIFLLLAHFGSLSFAKIGAALAGTSGSGPGAQGGIYTAIALCLVIGACGKSAQIPLYVWLPDAMEGPTPVSALIHAATMVTAGVYMISRTHGIFDRSPLALSVVAIIGAATAFFAATVGLVQTDIKRVLAYSTISQLGYMFLGCGVGAYSAAVFHLMTHAFFKALLFLAAGSVIHGLSGEQEMFKMGGLRKYLPITFWTMTCGVIAIAGFFPFAGFFSKDAILYEAFQHGSLGKLLYAVGLLTAGLTSFYMFRLWYLTFTGKYRGEEAHHDHAHGHDTHDHGHGNSHGHQPHESPGVMLFPLVILAIFSVCGGWIGIDRFGHFLAPVVGAVADPAELAGGKTLDITLSVVAVIVAALGWLVAHLLYSKGTEKAEKLAASMPTLHAVLMNKYGIDELYNAVIITPITLAARYLLGWIGEGVIIRGSAWLLAGITGLCGEVARRWQSGNLRSYSAWLAAGAAVFLIFAYYMQTRVIPGFDPGQVLHMILPAGK